MNEFDHPSFMKKNIIWLLVLVALVVFGLLFSNGYDKVVNESVDKMTTVTGNFSCLPLRSGEEPAEELCTLGVKSSNGDFYALDVSHIQDANTDLGVDETIAVTGFLLPEAEMNEPKWQAFIVKGVIKVNTLLRTR